MMGAGLKAVRGFAAAFFAWWFGALASMVPGRVLGVLTPGIRAIVLELDRDHARWRVVTGSEARDLPADEVKGCLRRHRSRGWAVGVHLNDDRMLRDRIHLPAAATENLREVVAFQLEHLTPFSRQEVAFDCRAAAGGATGDVMAVELLLLPVSVLGDALARASRLGCEPDFVSYAGDSIDPQRRLNLLADRAGRGTRPMSWAMPAVLGIVAAGLAAVAVWLPIDGERRHAAQLEARVQSVRAEAARIDRLRQSAEQSVTEAVKVTARKRYIASTVEIINVLSSLLPDDVWLLQLAVNDKTVQATGYAASTANVVELIENSPRFQAVKFLAPAHEDQQAGREQFSLSFEISQEEKR